MAWQQMCRPWRDPINPHGARTVCCATDLSHRTVRQRRAAPYPAGLCTLCQRDRRRSHVGVRHISVAATANQRRHCPWQRAATADRHRHIRYTDAPIILSDAFAEGQIRAFSTLSSPQYTLHCPDVANDTQEVLKHTASLWGFGSQLGSVDAQGNHSVKLYSAGPPAPWRTGTRPRMDLHGTSIQSISIAIHSYR